MERTTTEEMSPETAKCSPETELTLCLSRKTHASTAPIVMKSSGSSSKRGFSETLDLNLGSSSVERHSKGLADDQLDNEVSPKSKAQAVGWPPVRAFRKNAIKTCKFVKVAVDGAPYLRKVDLEMYNSYQQLLSTLEEMFSCFTICNYMNERKLMDYINGAEYVGTYEDKDGDWMLIGDVPWKMFVESCKRLRLMKSSEAIGLAPRTPRNEGAQVVKEASS